MKFTFSPLFRLSDYEQLLREVSGEIDEYCHLYGIRTRDMKADLHISYSKLKKY